jgi:hypothetical protein
LDTKFQQDGDNGGDGMSVPVKTREEAYEDLEKQYKEYEASLSGEHVAADHLLMFVEMCRVFHLDSMGIWDEHPKASSNSTSGFTWVRNLETGKWRLER